MKNQVVKIGVIVEGQTEAVFTRRLLELRFPGIVEIVMIRLGSGGNSVTPKGVHGINNPDPRFIFTVIDAQGEGGVIPALESEGKRLLDNGNKHVIGLRDMYGDEYDQKSGGVVNSIVNKQLAAKAASTISILDSSGRIKHFFSIMEVETWFLAMPGVLQKVNSAFTEDEVKRIAGVSKENDYEKVYHPSGVMKKLYQSASKSYTKSNSCILAITSKIDQADIENTLALKRTPAFKKFYDALIEV